MADSDPVQFGDYLLYDRIGVGGMAEIFLASSRGIEGFEKRLVIKRILPSLSSDSQFVRMFVEEAKLCATLRHPNIVQVYDLGEIDGQFFIAMEFVDGRDLLKTLAACGHRQLGFPTDLALYITAEVLKGLNYAHQLTGSSGKPLGIIHRDVSPSNVFLSFEGQVKIGDFGIAKASSREKTATGILKGKFGYMSPEQVLGTEIDHRADIFASGILLYELLSGHRLFVGPNDLAVLQKVRQAQVEPPLTHHRPDLDPQLVAIVERALHRDPQARFQTAEKMRQALSDHAFRKQTGSGPGELARFLQRLFLADPKEQARRARFRLPPIHLEPSDNHGFDGFGPTSTRDITDSEPSAPVAPPEHWDMEPGPETEITATSHPARVRVSAPNPEIQVPGETGRQGVDPADMPTLGQPPLADRDPTDHTVGIRPPDEPDFEEQTPFARESWTDHSGEAQATVGPTTSPEGEPAIGIEPAPLIQVPDETFATPSEDLEDMEEQTLLGDSVAVLAEPEEANWAQVSNGAADEDDDGPEGFEDGAERTIPAGAAGMSEFGAWSPARDAGPPTPPAGLGPYSVSEPLLSEVPSDDETLPPGSANPTEPRDRRPVEVPMPELFNPGEEDPDAVATEARGTAPRGATRTALPEPLRAPPPNAGSEGMTEPPLPRMDTQGSSGGSLFEGPGPHGGSDTRPMFRDRPAARAEIAAGSPGRLRQMRVKERVRRSAIHRADSPPEPEARAAEAPDSEVAFAAADRGDTAEIHRPARPWVWAVGAFGVTLLLAVGGAVIRQRMAGDSPGAIVLECPPERRVQVVGVGVFEDVEERTLELPAGRYTVRVLKGDRVVKTTRVEVTAGRSRPVPCP
jgi:serine/threonine protein kinase